MVSKLTLTLHKPIHIEEIISLIGSGKGKRLTDEIADKNDTPNAKLVDLLLAHNDRERERLLMFKDKDLLDGVDLAPEKTEQKEEQ